MKTMDEGGKNIRYLGVVDEDIDYGIHIAKTDNSEKYLSYNEIRHYHMYYEFVMVYEGSAIFDVNNIETFHHAGTIHLIRPRDHHTLISIGHMNYYTAKFRSSIISSEIIDLIENLPRALILHTDGATEEQFETEFEELFRLQCLIDDTEHADITQLEVKLRLQLMLIHFLNELRKLPRDRNTASEGNLVINKVLEYTREHFRENIALADVADYVGLSKNYLSSYFRSSMNMTYWNYLSRYRLDRAMSLIASTAEPIAQIAYNCGFNSYNTFIKAFREQYGITPTEYRKYIK